MKFDAILNVITDDRSLITYRKELNNITGGVLSTLLLQQILHWYKANNLQPFYKFKEACSSQYYRVGDSWTEELGFTRREFDTALKKLEEKGLVSHKTGTDRRTYYNVNMSTLGKELNRLYVKAESAVTESTNPPLHNSKTKLRTETTTENNNKGDDYLSDKEFNEAFFIYANNSRFVGNKLEAYEAYKKINIDTVLLSLSIKRYLSDPDVERSVGFKKFIENGIYLGYMPKYFKILQDNTWFEGIYNTSTHDFYVNSQVVGKLAPAYLLELIQDEKLEYVPAPTQKIA